MDSSRRADIRRLNDDEFLGVVDRFQPIRCWKVGLSYGSVVYFEMGDRLSRSSNDGSEEYFGSATLWLYGDYWRISRNLQELAVSETVDRTLVESELCQMFIGQTPVSFSMRDTYLEISMSDNLRILLQNSKDGGIDDDEDLMILFLPDGSILGYNTSSGLFLSSERDEYRASQLARGSQ